MATIKTSDFRKGIVILFKDQPYQIIEFQHVNPGKGSAFIRTKLKALAGGRVQEFTFKSGESVEELPVSTHEMQYLYKDNDNYIFMDNRTYEQYTVTPSFIGGFVQYLRPNDTYQILLHEDSVVGIRLPKKVRLTVVEADEGAKGNTATGATKVVTTETGAIITVPLFIKRGDTIAVDPETGSYIERSQ